VVVVSCIMALGAGIFRATHPNFQAARSLAGAIVVLAYLGCVWLVWRSGLEGKGMPLPELVGDLHEETGKRPGIGQGLAAGLAIVAGGSVLAWVVHGSLGMMRTALGPDPTQPVGAYSRHVLLMTGLLLALPGVLQAWHDRRRATTSLRPTRELLACSTLLVLLEPMGLGPPASDAVVSLAILALLLGGAITVLFASVERFVPVQVRGLLLLLTAVGMLVFAWRIG
jgi:hypothetical protein